MQYYIMAALDFLSSGWLVFEISTIKKAQSIRWLLISIAIFAGLVLIAWKVFDKPFNPSTEFLIFKVLVIILLRIYRKKRETRIADREISI